MSARLRDLIERRNRIVEQGRAILEGAAKDNNRDLTAEEQRNFDTSITDGEKLRTQIANEERQSALDIEMASSRGSRADNPGGGDRSGSDEQRSAAGRRALGTGRYAITTEDLDENEVRSLQRRGSDEYRANFNSFLRTGERRALDASTTGQNGSFLVTPVQFAQALLMRLDDEVFIRGLSTVTPVPNATSLGRVSLENDVADADWTSELKFGSEETSAGFGTRELTPHPLAKFAKISNKLIRVASIDVVSLLLQRLAYKFALTEEKAFLTGDGVQKPLGIFTASNDGIPTGRDIATGNTSTAITFDGLISAKYGLKAGYLRKARWLFSRTAITQIAKIRDDSGAGPGTGGYLWQPSQQIGQPDLIHGLPLMMSEYVPATFTTGKYVGAIADFSFYHIADALDMQIQRLMELFAMTNQTGVICRKETDGMPILAEAFVRVKLG